jgi:hypothetical protein
MPSRAPFTHDVIFGDNWPAIFGGIWQAWLRMVIWSDAHR